MSEQQTQKFSVSIVDEYVGFMDYYQGHGHSFESAKTVACMTVQTAINYTETGPELANSLLEESNVEEWELLDEKLSQEEIEQINNLDLSQVIKASEFNEKPFEQELKDFGPIGESEESPYCLLILHVYKE